MAGPGEQEGRGVLPGHRDPLDHGDPGGIRREV